MTWREDTWAWDPVHQGIRVSDQPGSIFVAEGPIDEEDGRIIACAPEMVRLLLEILDEHQPTSTVHHFARIEEVLRKAGVRSTPSGGTER